MHLTGPIQGPAGTIPCAHALDPQTVVRAPAGLPLCCPAGSPHSTLTETGWTSSVGSDALSPHASCSAMRSGGWRATAKQARRIIQSKDLRGHEANRRLLPGRGATV